MEVIRAATLIEISIEAENITITPGVISNYIPVAILKLIIVKFCIA